MFLKLINFELQLHYEKKTLVTTKDLIQWDHNLPGIKQSREWYRMIFWPTLNLFLEIILSWKAFIFSL